MYVSAIVIILSMILGLFLLQQRAFDEDSTNWRHAALRQTLESYQADLKQRNRSESQHLRSILATFGLTEDDLYRNVSDLVQR